MPKKRINYSEAIILLHIYKLNQNVGVRNRPAVLQPSRTVSDRKANGQDRRTDETNPA